MVSPPLEPPATVENRICHHLLHPFSTAAATMSAAATTTAAANANTTTAAEATFIAATNTKTVVATTTTNNTPPHHTEQVKCRLSTSWWGTQKSVSRCGGGEPAMVGLKYNGHTSTPTS